MNKLKSCLKSWQKETLYRAATFSRKSILRVLYSQYDLLK